MDPELKDYLDSRFAQIDDRFARLEQEVATLRQDMDQQFVEVRDEIHKTGVLIEGVDAKVDLVAEGVKSNTEVMHRLRDDNRQELREFRTVMEASHRHLESRVSLHDVRLNQLAKA